MHCSVTSSVVCTYKLSTKKLISNTSTLPSTSHFREIMFAHPSRSEDQLQSRKPHPSGPRDLDQGTQRRMYALLLNMHVQTRGQGLAQNLMFTNVSSYLCVRFSLSLILAINFSVYQTRYVAHQHVFPNGAEKQFPSMIRSHRYCINHILPRIQHHFLNFTVGKGLVIVVINSDNM